MPWEHPTRAHAGCTCTQGHREGPAIPTFLNCLSLVNGQQEFTPNTICKYCHSCSADPKSADNCPNGKQGGFAPWSCCPFTCKCPGQGRRVLETHPMRSYSTFHCWSLQYGIPHSTKARNTDPDAGPITAAQNQADCVLATGHLPCDREVQPRLTPIVVLRD